MGWGDIEGIESIGYSRRVEGGGWEVWDQRICSQRICTQRTVELSGLEPFKLKLKLKLMTTAKH